ncbi:hypothetical protein YPPY10_2079, partial [Yersinia pestis PY-10]
MVVYRANQP